MHRTDEAAARYQQIIDRHPAYLACYFRLASMARARGQRAEAEEHIKRALSIDSANADAWYASFALSQHAVVVY